MFQIHCLESKTDKVNNLFSRFCIEPLNIGQGLTIGNALRRVLLSDLVGIAIVGVRIDGVNHEFSTIPNVKEDVIEILLNLKQIVFKGNIKEPVIARLFFQGPGIITADDIELSDNLEIVEPRQYIASLTSSDSIEMEFLIEKGKSYSLSEKTINNIPSGFLALDAIFMPVRKVNFFVETSRKNLSSEIESLVLEVYTDGSITPTEAISSASEFLENIFQSLRLTDSPSKVSLVEKESQPEFNGIMIEELELSVRAYNCLKRANIHTLEDLLRYSQDDLLEFKNFGQKSADEVCDSLQVRFGKTLRKSIL
jgi:DNA-directed RNA polymerase subunit alpha